MILLRIESNSIGISYLVNYIRIIDSIWIGGRRIKFQTRGKVKKIPPPRAEPEGAEFF